YYHNYNKQLGCEDLALHEKNTMVARVNNFINMTGPTFMFLLDRRIPQQKTLPKYLPALFR
ncbi:hypothetical protein ACJX0J_034478, partial [Zea mays]